MMLCKYVKLATIIQHCMSCDYIVLFQRKIEKLRQELKSALANAMEEKMENQHLRAENRELLTKLSRTEADLQAERVLNRKVSD